MELQEGIDGRPVMFYARRPTPVVSGGKSTVKAATPKAGPLMEVVEAVRTLGLTWQASLEDPMFGVESTPTVADGVIYTTSSYSRVFAFES